MKRVGLGMLLLIIAAAVYGAAMFRRADMEKSAMTDEVRKAAGGSYAKIADGVVHYQVSGPDTARAVVLVHGFSVPYYIWDPVWDTLSKAGLHVIRLDLFGRGYSDRPEAVYSAALFDRQVIGLLDALKITQPIDIAGLSMGGEVAEYFANHHPERTHSVILVDPGFDHGTGKLPWQMHTPIVRDYYMAVTVAPGMAAGQMSDFAHPDRFPEWPAKYEPQMRYPGFRRAILSTRVANEGRDLSKEFAELGKKQIPVLLIWGKQDKTVPFARSAEVMKLVPQAEFHPIDDAGHVPYMEQTAVVNPIIVNFLRPPVAAPVKAKVTNKPAKKK
jgi:pimeloyl-ACP methyl ester carboxylesterase